MSKHYENNPIQKKDSLDDITSVTYNAETMKLDIPQAKEGSISIVGSNAIPVINLAGKVNKPLQTKNVKITLQLEIENKLKTRKEFTIQVKGIYENAGENEKPQVIPALSEWYGLTGTMKIDNTTTIVVEDAKFKQAARMLIEDLEELDIHVSLGEKRVANSIVFTYDSENNYEKEGYGIEVKDSIITISAEQYTGAFYATRSLHQILKTNETKEISNGYIRDYPKYRIRSFMLDVGRKFTDLDYVYEIMKTMSYYKMNDFQLHLNDNAVFLDSYKDAADVIENAYTAFRLESDIEGNNSKLTSGDGYYTKAEFTALIDNSATYGITIVPEFDTPGHALSFVKVRPDLMYKGKIENEKPDQDRAAMLDLTNPETVPFIKSMYNEYLDGENPVIGNVPIHIGSDEFYGDAEVYRKYVDEMLRFIRDEKQRTVRIWGSLSDKPGETKIASENVQMDVWNTDWAEPSEMFKQGFDIINIDDSQIYLVPGANYYFDYLEIENLFNNYEANKFSNGVEIDESHPQFLGGAFALWSDYIDRSENGITSYDMFDRIFAAIPVLAQKNWGSSVAGDYETFKQLSTDVSYAPDTNPRFIVESKTETVMSFDFTTSTNDLSGNDNELIKENNTTLDKGLHFNGKNSYVETPLMNVGPSSTLEIELVLSDTDSEQVLMETDCFGKIYAVNKAGYIGYEYENLAYSFDYQLTANKQTQLVFKTELHETKLYVNGEEIQLTEATSLPFNTLILPVQRISGLDNSLHGKVTKFKLSHQ